VEEVLHQGATEAEIAETLDVGLYMGGSLAMKSVRYAVQILDEIRRAR
jgi:alkylhydroperoxidase/carboxymuconolactone decarboxylase family protein YurZ